LISRLIEYFDQQKLSDTVEENDIKQETKESILKEQEPVVENQAVVEIVVGHSDKQQDEIKPVESVTDSLEHDSGSNEKEIKENMEPKELKSSIPHLFKDTATADKKRNQTGTNETYASKKAKIVRPEPIKKEKPGVHLKKALPTPRKPIAKSSVIQPPCPLPANAPEKEFTFNPPAGFE
jgi:hypothetical protein